MLNFNVFFFVVFLSWLKFITYFFGYNLPEDYIKDILLNHFYNLLPVDTTNAYVHQRQVNRKKLLTVV